MVSFLRLRNRAITPNRTTHQEAGAAVPAFVASFSEGVPTFRPEGRQPRTVALQAVAAFEASKTLTRGAHLPAARPQKHDLVPQSDALDGAILMAGLPFSGCDSVQLRAG
jgi:hypothetical protein